MVAQTHTANNNLEKSVGGGGCRMKTDRMQQMKQIYMYYIF